MFELCEDLLDRIEIGAIGRQEENSRAGRANEAADACGLVRAEIVENDDVALLERGDQHLLDIGDETLAIDWAVDHERGVDPIAAQGCNEGHRLPVSMRGLGHEPLTFTAPAPQRRHVCLDPRLVDEDEARGIHAGLARLPAFALSRDVRAILLAGEQAFF